MCASCLFSFVLCVTDVKHRLLKHTFWLQPTQYDDHLAWGVWYIVSMCKEKCNAVKVLGVDDAAATAAAADVATAMINPGRLQFQKLLINNRR